MENTKFTRNICMTSINLFLIIFFCHVSISPKAYVYSEILSNPDYNEIKATILRWWKRNNVAEHFECKYEPESVYSNKLFDIILAPEIKSFPCHGNSTSPHYYYDGTSKDNFLEGKGKLVFMSENEFSRLSHADEILEKVLKSKLLNICFKTNDIYGRWIKEIDGTFENGFLHGSAIITYTDNSVSISNFFNGKASGFRRDFDPQKALIDAGAYDLGWKTGNHWILRFGHLIYQNRQVIDDNISPVVVFPITDTGDLEDPIAGDYFPQSAALENVRKIQLDAVPWSESDCLFHLKYRTFDKENYTYSLSSKKKYPHYGTEGYLYLSQMISRSPYNVPSWTIVSIKLETWFQVSIKLETWFHGINTLLDVKTTDDYFGASSALEVLWQLKPEFSDVDVDNSARLISGVTVDPDTQTVTAVILGSTPVHLFFEMGDISVDNNWKLNGFNDLSVVPEHQSLIPRDKTLGWSPIRIMGNFRHGELNGFVL